ncbi:kelch-like protein 17 isoform X6 [Camelus ferus]|uniref:Kelch-like protein 17 isoform X6 n=2 Tax=Camelus TaxID=9836 RepID=A0A8B8U955_CAMFR|nr:kelch-like protein 17 isoform X6 [Camelus ferus]
MDRQPSPEQGLERLFLTEAPGQRGVWCLRRGRGRGSCTDSTVGSCVGSDLTRGAGGEQSLVGLRGGSLDVREQSRVEPAAGEVQQGHWSLTEACPEAERARPRQPRPTAPMEGAMQLLSREGHTVSHNSKRHYHDAFVAMSRMRQRGLLCDIVLHVAAKEIRAHKVVLASCSPYFHAMFTNEMSESRQTHVTLHDIDPQALDQLVQFAYTAEIVVGEGNVQTLLPAASLLQLNGVRDACCKFLLSQLDPSNCLGIRGFADTHSCSDLLKAAHRNTGPPLDSPSQAPSGLHGPPRPSPDLRSEGPHPQVLELVSSDSLNVPSEEDVYRAVLSWVKHDVDARRQHVPRLMKCVRLPLLSRDFLLGHVDAESLVRHHPDCKDLLIEALKFHLLPEQRGVLGTSRTRPRRCEGAGPVLFAVGGGSLFAIHGDCEAYDTRTDRWHVVASMSTRRARVGVAAVGNRLYAVGGYDGTSDLATVESYDPVTNTWQPEVSMGTRRSCLGVASLHGLLYAAGGYDGASCLNRSAAVLVSAVPSATTP